MKQSGTTQGWKKIKKRIASPVGLTLLEVLITISLISVLMAMGYFSFIGSQKRGRDARRKGDLHTLQVALEQYYTTCGFAYPTPNGTLYDPVICTTPGVSIAILPTMILDPLPSAFYYCPTPVASICTSDQYAICAKMEAEASPELCLTNKQ